MIAHVDGDAFFASVYQATHPETKGKPVAIGKERAIATAVSYEAKARGVKRGMLVSDIKKICPECIVASSNYYIYETFCRKMIAIADRYSPIIERYSIDEIFAEINNPEDALSMKQEIEKSLDITVSVGIADTKCLAKIGSNFNKPSGYVVITPENREQFLVKTSIGNVWGIGWRLTKRMESLGIKTALDFVQQPEYTIKGYFNKSVLELWHELQGNRIYSLNTAQKTTYQSIQKTQTYTPATNNKEILLARLLDHIEKAFIKARRHNYRVGSIQIFLKTQKFTYKATNIKLPEKVMYPFLIRNYIHSGFDRIFNPKILYRASGCTLFDLEKADTMQESLFSAYKENEEKVKKFYPLVDQKKISFGTSLFNKERFNRTMFQYQTWE
jgi:DNA polymerase-4/DNA polymerase V